MEQNPNLIQLGRGPDSRSKRRLCPKLCLRGRGQLYDLGPALTHPWAAIHCHPAPVLREREQLLFGP